MEYTAHRVEFGMPLPQYSIEGGRSEALVEALAALAKGLRTDTSLLRSVGREAVIGEFRLSTSWSGGTLRLEACYTDGYGDRCRRGLEITTGGALDAV